MCANEILLTLPGAFLSPAAQKGRCVFPSQLPYLQLPYHTNQLLLVDGKLEEV